MIIMREKSGGTSKSLKSAMISPLKVVMSEK